MTCGGMDEGDSAARSFLLHRDAPGIFPVHWSLRHGLPLAPPPGYQGQDFHWADYLKQNEARGLLHNTASRSGTLLHLLEAAMPEVVVHVDSMDIFPISCRTSPDSEKQHLGSQSEAGPGNGKYCCPKIYFNHRCFSGPYLNKGRIAELPQFIGPGSCVLVLKEVLTLLINSAYKPSRVLRELQLHPETSRWQQEASRWQQEGRGYGETLKAKYKGKTYRATVEMVRTADRVADFCRKTCIKLECCPNLFGPRMVLERCSENCSVLTKTKYSRTLPSPSRNSMAAKSAFPTPMMMMDIGSLAASTTARRVSSMSLITPSVMMR
ncbi:hypothetical protein CRUP_018597, partial [Coryphaenoides rupestris]